MIYSEIPFSMTCLSDCLGLQMKPAASVADPATVVMREFGMCT